MPLSSGWMEGGPELPLEFARVGDLGELAVVLLEGAPMRWSWWASLDVANANQARESLREREEIDPDRPEWVGSSPGDPRLPPGPLRGGACGEGSTLSSSSAGDSARSLRTATH